MYETLTVIILAVSWLLQRFYTLTRVPVDELVHTLKIEIPRASKMSIDSITSGKVHLHWDLPSIEQKIISFILYLNGTQIMVLSGTETHCCISGLKSDSRYKLDLVCINSTGYKAKSDSVYIKTKSDELENHPNKVLLENPDNLFKYLTVSEDTSDVEKLVTPFSVNPNVEGRASRSRSNTVNSLNENTVANLTSTASTYAELPDPRSIDDIEELRYHLESGQEELHTILGQQAQIYEDFKEYEATLIQERDSLRERKKLEDGSRQSMKSEIKMLDETRRLTELRKSKQEALLSNKQKNIEKMENDLKLWNEQIDEFHEKKLEMEKTEPIIQKQNEIEIQDKKKQIEELNEEITKLEEQNRNINSQRKQQDSITSFTKLLKKLSNHTDDQGSVDNEGIKALEAIKLLDLDVYDQLKTSINTDNKLEAEWRAQQQREVSRCQKLADTYKALKAENQLLKDGSFTSSKAWDNNINNNNNSSSNNSIPVPVPVAIPQYVNNKSNGYHLPISSPPSSSNFNYNFKSDSSPSINSNLPQSSNSFNHTPSSIWNRVGSSEQQSPPLLRTSNLESFQPNEVEPPSVDHYLPTNLINEEFSDFLFNKQKDATVTTKSSTPSQEYIDFSNPSAINHFSVNDSNASTKSIFHQDFDMASLNQKAQIASSSSQQPQQPPSHIFNHTSPQLSFQNDILGFHSSPNTSINGPVNDINSIISNINQNDVLGPLKMSTPSNSQVQSPLPLKTVDLDHESSRKENGLNPFSPRRLSSVFSFGRKNTDHNAEAISNTLQPTSSKNSHSSTPNNTASKFLQQSKFFNNHKATHSADSNSEPQSNNNPFFSFHHNGSNKSSHEEPSNDEFLNSVWETNDLKLHNRNISLNSSKSLEKDNASWFKFHNSATETTTNNGHHHQESTSSVGNGELYQTELLVPVELTNTNKSSNTTSIKSGKSTAESTVASSPSFFRRKSFFSFGKDNNNSLNEKSPIKRIASPIPQIDIESEVVEEYTGTNHSASSNASMKMFSRNKRTSSQNRKQSNSSSFQESQNESINENSSTASVRSNSIVKKLNFFKNGKEINDIEEALED